MLRALILVAAIAATVKPMVWAEAQSARTPQSRLLDALQANRLPLTMSGGRPSGAGWDWLVRQAAEARFTLIGEEPGVVETAQLSAALFTSLRESGYTRMGIQLSPLIAQGIEAAGRLSGVQGIEKFLTTRGIFTFYNMREEAQFLSDIVKSGPANERVLWGFDREIFSDEYLISRLEPRVPPRAREAFTRLKQAAASARLRYQQTRNGDDLFLLSGDEALISALRAVWPDPDRDSDTILRTLEESLAIEAAERSGGLWPYLQRRAQWMRHNFAGLVNSERGRNGSAKILMRFGYGLTIRGANYFNVFDLGAMADEVAALTGERAFHILVIPDRDSRQAVLGSGGFTSVLSDSVDQFRAGDMRLTRVFANANAAGHEVIDLRALRPLAMRGLENWNSDIVRTIHGFDAAVIWKGARASAGLTQ